MSAVVLLPINEIFDTIQGEATYTGTPSTFIRLQGCDVGCPWCDTKHTWALDPRDDRPIADILAKTSRATPFFCMAEPRDLAEHVLGRKPAHVVITGGEPCMYDLAELTERLLAGGRTVQVETSGTRPVIVAGQTWITVSPKIDMAGGQRMVDQALERANEIKMPVGKGADIDKLDRLLSRLRPVPPIWLQPLSESDKATALCVEIALERNWRVSIQVHKVMGLR